MDIQASHLTWGKKERKKKANCDMCLVSCCDLKGEKYDNSINNLTAISLHYLMFPKHC